MSAHSIPLDDEGLSGFGYRDAVPEPRTPRLGVRGMCLSIKRRIILDDVSFTVGAGEVFGILGPNGSGKSSLLRCLTGLTKPDLGTVTLNGKTMSPGAQPLRAALGVVFQDPSIDDRLTARDNLRLGARLFALSGKEAAQRADALLKFMELEDRGNDVVRIFSGGMRRRLELARALIHQPAMLLLDEPTTGLDPSAFERTWQRLLALRRLHGLTLMLSTHRADEAARCDRLLVIDRGHVVACDTPKGLLKRVAGDVIVVDAHDPETLRQELAEILGVVSHVNGGQVLLERQDGHMFIPRLVEAFAPGRIKAVALRQPTLADAFFHLTGRGLGAASEAL